VKRAHSLAAWGSRGCPSLLRGDARTCLSVVCVCMFWYCVCMPVLRARFAHIKLHVCGASEIMLNKHDGLYSETFIKCSANSVQKRLRIKN
jgi:hypothetical protein